MAEECGLAFVVVRHCKKYNIKTMILHRFYLLINGDGEAGIRGTMFALLLGSCIISSNSYIMMVDPLWKMYRFLENLNWKKSFLKSNLIPVVFRKTIGVKDCLSASLVRRVMSDWWHFCFVKLSEIKQTKIFSGLSDFCLLKALSSVSSSCWNSW